MKRFDQAVEELARRGEGVISSYYHPTEFVTFQFWDAVNFFKGASRERSEWQRPGRRAPEDSERRYRILRRYVEHAKKTPGVRFVTARDLLPLYESSSPRLIDRRAIAEHMAARQTFLATEQGALSAAEMLLALLGMEPQFVEGPTYRQKSTYSAETVPRPAFDRAKADAVSFIRRNRRLPAAVWVGSEKLSIADFAASLAAEDSSSPTVRVRKGNLEMENYFATDPATPYNWSIHPEGFKAPELLELARLQGWTLKPARLR